jgi:nitroreductase
MTRQQIAEATDFDDDTFIKTRYSVRHFTGEEVSPEAVRDVVGRALNSPRVCNRESRRIHAAYQPDVRNHLLSFHHGNSGFGHKLGAVLVVTVDIREFDMIGERNQPWIDGGLFAMSLVYGFRHHSAIVAPNCALVTSSGTAAADLPSHTTQGACRCAAL